MAKRKSDDDAPVTRRELKEMIRQMADLQNKETTKRLRATGKPETIVRQQAAFAHAKTTREVEEHFGRPRSETGRLLPMDPADIRASRIGLRVHSDLRLELERAAREDGLLLTVFINRTLAKAINDRAGTRVLDAIGRYADPKRR